MPIIFYHANFCPECGNRHEAMTRRWLQHRYFCSSCAQQLGHRWDWLPLALALGGLLLGIFLPLLRRPIVLPQTSEAPPSHISLNTPVVSAQDATAQLKAVESSPSLITYQCGARTQKGTACKHRVTVQGQRCFQHQGRRSVMR